MIGSLGRAMGRAGGIPAVRRRAGCSIAAIRTEDSDASRLGRRVSFSFRRWCSSRRSRGSIRRLRILLGDALCVPAPALFGRELALVPIQPELAHLRLLVLRLDDGPISYVAGGIRACRTGTATITAFAFALLFLSVLVFVLSFAFSFPLIITFARGGEPTFRNVCSINKHPNKQDLTRKCGWF